MAKRKPLFKNKNLTLNTSKIFLRGHLLKPFFLVITNPNFSNWIRSRYGLLRQWQTQFSSLFFLLMKHRPIVQHILSKNTTVLPLLERDYSLYQNFFFNVNLLPLTSFRITRGQLEKYKALNGTFPYKNQVRTDSLFAHPKAHLSEYKTYLMHSSQSIFFNKQMIMEDREEKDKTGRGTSSHEGPVRSDSIFTHAEADFSKYESNLTLRTQQILSKTSKMLITPRLEMPWRASSEVVSPLLTFHHNNQRKTSLSSKNNPSTIGRRSLDEKRLKIIPSESEPTLFHQSKIKTSGKDVSIQDSEIGTEENNYITTSKQPIIKSDRHPISDDSTLSLHYFNHLKFALEDLKNLTPNKEKKITEGESLIKKSTQDNSSEDHNTSDITQNININHLTEQVYQMLERKIRIERERRGL